MGSLDDIEKIKRKIKALEEERIVLLKDIHKLNSELKEGKKKGSS